MAGLPEMLRLAINRDELIGSQQGAKTEDNVSIAIGISTVQEDALKGEVKGR